MATIKLSAGGFTLIPEGTYDFQIVSCNYKETFNKIEFELRDKQGRKLTERYDLNNDGGIGAFSFFAKAASKNWDLETIDPDDLVGKFIKARVEHTKVPKRDDPTQTMTFMNLKDKAESDGWETEPVDDDIVETNEPDLSFLD